METFTQEDLNKYSELSEDLKKLESSKTELVSLSLQNINIESGRLKRINDLIEVTKDEIGKIFKNKLSIVGEQ